MKSRIFTKHSSLTLLLYCAIALAAGAEVAQQSAISDIFDGEIGPHHRVWAGGAEGGQGRVVEIGTGMHYLDNGQWLPSDPSFETRGNAFVVEKVQHKLRLNGNINVPGAVTLTTPDGITLKSTPVAIGLYDPISGESAIVGAIRDTAGTQIAANQILFENAFSGI